MFELSEVLQAKIIATIAILIFFIIIKVIVNKITQRTLINFSFGLQRKTIVLKVANSIMLTIATVSLVAVWGIKSNQIFTFITSVLTVIGIAFMAQWSLLANITAGLILFFNHPLRIGDTIQIIDKDYPMEGQIEDITMFFLHLKDKDQKVYTIPNAIVIQKTLTITDSPRESK